MENCNGKWLEIRQRLRGEGWKEEILVMCSNLDWILCAKYCFKYREYSSTQYPRCLLIFYPRDNTNMVITGCDMCFKTNINSKLSNTYLLFTNYYSQGFNCIDSFNPQNNRIR